MILIDGSSYLFRAYYALPSLTNSKGQATGAIVGFINMLKKLLHTYPSALVGVVFDSKQPTFRHKLFPAYKQQRIIMPDDLATQIPWIHKLIDALGIALIQVPGVEADDLLGTLAKRAVAHNHFVIIATNDKDLAQLVDQDLILLNTMTDQILDRQGVIAKFKVPPELIIDYLALVGDQVDNIPGVLNIGPKTAVKLLEQYKNLQAIMQNCHLIPGKIGENLTKALADLPLYLKLLTIDLEVPISFTAEQFTLKARKLAELREIFTELEIHSWLKDLENTKLNNTVELTTAASSKLQISIDPGMETSFTSADLCKLFTNWRSKITASHTIAITLQFAQTKDPQKLKKDLKGISLAIIADLETQEIEIDLAKFSSVPLSAAEQPGLISLLDFLQDPKKAKILYDAKELAKFLATFAMELVPPFFDITLEAYILNSTQPLKLATELLTAGKILEIHQRLWPKIQASTPLQQMYLELELPLILVLAKMEQVGVLLDQAKLEQQGRLLKQKIAELSQQVFVLAAGEFNLNSPKQLQEILYTKLKLPILQNTPTGQPSTAEPVLQELALHFELPNLLLQYRSLSKLLSTYVEKLPDTINPLTGRVHTTYHQTVTTTGRLSSSDPNLQNIPIRTSEGRSIREAFIARPGFKILAADYSQIELRILAHLSEDPGLILAFSQKIDIHTVTAAEIFKLAYAEVTAELRRKAKAINFGLIYGMSDFGLAKQLKIPRSEAQAYITTYFAKFPKVLEFMEKTKQFAATNGFVETMFGRRLYLPDLLSKNKVLSNAAARAAINAPMQGAQADLIKMAMIKIAKWIQATNIEVFMLMQVHDELIFEVAREKLDLAAVQIKKIMENVADLKVALEVEIGVGDNWAEAH